MLTCTHGATLASGTVFRSSGPPRDTSSPEVLPRQEHSETHGTSPSAPSTAGPAQLSCPTPPSVQKSHGQELFWWPMATTLTKAGDTGPSGPGPTVPAIRTVSASRSLSVHLESVGSKMTNAGRRHPEIFCGRQSLFCCQQPALENQYLVDGQIEKYVEAKSAEL